MLFAKKSHGRWNRDYNKKLGLFGSILPSYYTGLEMRNRLWSGALFAFPEMMCTQSRHVVLCSMYWNRIIRMVTQSHDYYVDHKILNRSHFTGPNVVTHESCPHFWDAVATKIYEGVVQDTNRSFSVTVFWILTGVFFKKHLTHSSHIYVVLQSGYIS